MGDLGQPFPPPPPIDERPIINEVRENLRGVGNVNLGHTFGRRKITENLPQVFRVIEIVDVWLDANGHLIHEPKDLAGGCDICGLFLCKDCADTRCHLCGNLVCRSHYVIRNEQIICAAHGLVRRVLFNLAGG